MRRIKVSHDINVSGWGLIKTGTAFRVVKFNKRYVYVDLSPGTILRLARKSDCAIMY